ncbi:MAG TPA: substrate-binding domain-containing protein, partial [Candidatus Limnocylindrales bacterium]|nr:substrate-binding domain-containing protein [Candidatus Limnocylindrales bacterium]
MTQAKLQVESLTGVSRRRFLQGSALVGFSAFLAACSSGTTASQVPATAFVPTPPPESETPNASPTPLPSPTGPLQFANWEAYIDLAGKAGDAGVYSPGSSPTIEQFKKQYGVDVNYQEKINDNEEFYALIQPALSTGLSSGWDLIVMTDWMAARLISKGWIEKIDQSSVPNC